VQSNPSLRSRLGCGGLLLLFLALPPAVMFSIALGLGGNPRTMTMGVGDQAYPIGGLWWLVTPLAILSVFAVFRLGFGYRDWLAPVLSAVWLGIAAAFWVKTGQSSFAAFTAVITLLLTSGIWRARQETDDEEGRTEPNGLDD
jgi:hypothetical protein